MEPLVKWTQSMKKNVFFLSDFPLTSVNEVSGYLRSYGSDIGTPHKVGNASFDYLPKTTLALGAHSQFKI